MSLFPNKVNLNQAPAVRGDFASQNPRSSLLAGQGALAAPAGGLTVGNFAFVSKTVNGEIVSQAYTSGDEIGFLAREEQALITAYLAGDTLVVPQGFMVTLYTQGDFFAYFGDGATPGQAVYADETTGAAISGAGSPTSVTGSIGFAGTASFATDVMTVVTQTAGSLIEVGDTVTSAGVTGGTTITALLTGTPGAVGSTYSLSTTPGTIATQAATTTSDTLNVTAVGAGALSVGDVISGTNITSGTTIAAFGTATGGIGTYIVSVPGGGQLHTASETITVPAGNVQTQFTVASFANPGELAKITTAY
jgi:hypothetical protein